MHRNQPSTVRILGIDPGTRVAGYGLVDCDRSRVEAIALGAWTLGKEAPLHYRLGKLAAEFDRLVSHYRPTHLCLEDSFVARFSRSALLIGHARGAILARAFACGLVVHSMMPTEAKRRVTGDGHASKELVARCLKSLLGLQGVERLPHDATDGLALAYALGLEIRSSLRLKSSQVAKPLVSGRRESQDRET